MTDEKKYAILICFLIFMLGFLAGAYVHKLVSNQDIVILQTK